MEGKIQEGYDDLRQNFIEQLQNPYLQEFFVDEYIVVDFRDKDSWNPLKSKNLTLRESLNVLLNYQYQFVYYYINKISTNDSPMVVYSYANYVEFHNRFRALNSRILQYTKERTDLVSEKWFNIWIPFMVITFVIMLVGWVFYRLHIRKYEKILNLF